jgi:hypothetical protein
LSKFGLFPERGCQVSAESTNSDARPQLRRNSLGLSELAFQGVTHIAPATNMVFTFPIIALKAGPVMPLSFLLATIASVSLSETPCPSFLGTYHRVAATTRSLLVGWGVAAASWLPGAT